MKLLNRVFPILSALAFSGLLFTPALKAQTPTAAAFVVMDHQSGHILGGFNSDKKMQVASLTKIATAVVVFDWASASNQDLDQLVSITPGAAALFNGQGIDWKAGDKATMRDLLYAALLQSDNCAAEALADHVGRSLEPQPGDQPFAFAFIAQMNALARKLGMVNTRFLNPTGLDTLERKLPYSTAEDIGKLSIYAMSNPALRFIVSQKERRVKIQRADASSGDYLLRNTNELLGQNGIDGLKTGTTRRAGQCLVISAARSPEVIQDGNTFFPIPRRLEVVVLGATDRFADGRALMERGWSLHEEWVAAGRPEDPSPRKLVRNPFAGQ